jgi:hypothetical protein
MGQTIDRYMKKLEGKQEYFVAWSLATPPHQYGQWSLVTVLQSKKTRRSGRLVEAVSTLKVQFKRALIAPEIEAIYAMPYMWWGVKVSNQPWALLECRSNSKGYQSRLMLSQPIVGSLRSTGV